ncbi:alpha/beta fold hydrolase [Acuticoccus kandeliae]|uniref:alpha/beta fold hydrolase n=1 Tax=Acuticoccus kandeliae TaxID=2073160 RepID=UPI000D3E7844|nr:alpha/beta hydrolase [Acuticoccus kandeliae]
MFTTDATRRDFTTGDGVRLSYLEAGAGQPLVMVPGWSQTALQWSGQIEAFAPTHRVIAVDMRGHGASDKPGHGYKVSRLAQDLHELISGLGLGDVALMGHSMGCSVIWALIDLYGTGGLDRLVFVDQSAFLADTPLLTPEEKAEAGAIFPPDALFAAIARLTGGDPATATAEFLRALFSPGVPAEMLDAVVALNIMLPRRHAGALILNHVFSDWRDVIRRIDRPSLCIGAEGSSVPVSAMLWQAATIPGARAAILSREEGGSHFMFLENPGWFNGVVGAFLREEEAGR